MKLKRRCVSRQGRRQQNEIEKEMCFETGKKAAE